MTEHRRTDTRHAEAPAGQAREHSLRIERLNFAYGDTPILRGIDLHVREGEFLALLGPSGSGKSTLLRLIAGLESPTAGRLDASGRPVSGPGTDRAVVFQHYALFPWMTVVDNVAEAVAKAHPRLPRSERRARALKQLERVGLGEVGGNHPFELSGGMQQRAAIARALALESPFLLMDEPFGALDPINRAKLQDLLIEVWQGSTPRRTVVFVTHDVDEALLLADRIAVMGATPGRIIAEHSVPFARPRQRAALFKDAGFHRLREEIAEALDADTLAHLEAA
ncbi:ABC transporter ATP-binding protein [Pseudothauera nasutitermitis]|uniref:ABC transporter ATP-binding protein n=1 Tax=Pseudothauera nasutitermitis TaxID=2565930 RepID=A0A4S4B5W4_9RHOO|nr:ABC transporter ATP-binding protein [Pseudothauera nasutitermitis]THF67206.1 ABC transporter ATP-binding protein [Pseudothauera nasutitermitis]